MNIINAIFNIVTDFSYELTRDLHGLNRANQMGGALEKMGKRYFLLSYIDGFNIQDVYIKKSQQSSSIKISQVN